MEAADVAESDLVNGTLEKPLEGNVLGSNTTNENEISDSVSAQSIGVLENPSQVEGLDSSKVGKGASAAVSDNKILNSSKMAMKDKGGRNGDAVIARNQRASLSKSLSFTNKVAPTNNLRKSATFARPKKTDARNFVDSEGGFPAKQTNFGTRPIARQSLLAKSDSVDATANGTSFKLKSNGGHKNPMRDKVPEKIDDDGHSNSLSTTPRRSSTGSGFAFRLDERAEKRKEFFMKLEEKTHAKEAENTDLQAESRESQEAEIRRLRKSLTFKATPMPNFYQEPGPQKAELKKIPPTRPRSPKLGRHKNSDAASENSPENSTLRPNPSKSNEGATDSKAAPLVSKKLGQKSLSKISSQKSTAKKPQGKPVGLKPKSLDAEKEAAIDGGEPTMEESQPKTTVAGVETDPLGNTITVDATICDISDLGIASDEVVDPEIAAPRDTLVED